MNYKNCKEDEYRSEIRRLWSEIEGLREIERAAQKRVKNDRHTMTCSAVALESDEACDCGLTDLLMACAGLAKGES